MQHAHSSSTRRLATIVLIILVIVFSSCSSTTGIKEESDSLYQVSMLNALMLGDYDGFVTLRELSTKGNLGIGTFDGLDGEMIFLDGVMYKALHTGAVEQQSMDETTPFAVATYFTRDFGLESTALFKDIEAFKEQLDVLVESNSADFNCFYAATITGTFSMVHVRSVPPQEKPYKVLSQIASTQPEYIYEDIEGTIVAFRSPEYVDKINLPGWHLHFISEDKSKGGHLLDATMQGGTFALDEIREFEMVLPDRESFASMAVATDLQAQTVKVEGKE
ncbi:MAG TPA: acetolactate decarboxylase [Sphaerochaeta sp.]|nr:MAG: alpha-acetolactate decarboxylase [Spirochaetes bacterium GWC2_52_13]HCG64091.1 acetolactate decarboxylase [Sphaerochaeta sp.]HCS37261.1 acetolactate decarboxylase [Sphaerochaeta sp.]